MAVQRFVVIGLGGFGSWVARALYDEGFDVIAIDLSEELVDRYTDQVTRCVVGDGTDPELLERVGASNADAAVVSTGEDLAASIMSVMALKEVGVEDIYTKVPSLRAARALEHFDIREMIFPEREAARRLARRLESTTILDYVSLGEGYSIQEMAVPDAWIGQSLRELGLPHEYGVQVVALFDVLRDRWNVVPDPDEPLTESDVAVVAGSDETLARLTQVVESE